MAKKKDVLSEMARVGSNLAKAPLLKNGNWAKSISEEYSDITNAFRSEDLSSDLAELKRLQRAHSKAKQG